MVKTTEQGKTTLRRAGVLMPVSALPSGFGIGTLGKGAYRFVDWLSESGMKIWQVLPLLPTGYGDSPYQSCASNALNYYFIDFDLLREDGLLERSDYADIPWSTDERRVDYGAQFVYKTQILKKAFARFDAENAGWKAFVNEGKSFDFAVFMSLKSKFGYKPWNAWDEEFSKYNEQRVRAYAEQNEEEIAFWQFTQFIFLKQWRALHKYANEKGIAIMGDMPIYVSYDSVETWKYRKNLFMLGADGNTSLRAGVPPDAFCDDGQLWGNPVYDWKKLKKDGYAWWKERILYELSLYDIVRIDHFRAFDRFYAIPEDAETAKEGQWMPGPKAELFKGLENCAIVAEDLGVIDDGVRKLLKDTGYPGMKVFEFAFDGNPENEYLPTYYNTNSVAYTGTHDNDTLRSFILSMDKTERRAFEKTFEEQCLAMETPYLCETIEDECESVIRLLMASKADTVIIPMHDILCFGAEARLNAPSTVTGNNWTFRYTERDFKRRASEKLKAMTEEYNR